MKKLWFFLAMTIFVLASCSDGGNDDPSNPTPKPEQVKTEITIDAGIVTNGLSFSAAEGEQSVSFSVNANWTLSVASTTGGSTWCKASATSGSKGTANVKFTVTENTEYDDRSVSVTIKAGTVSKTFTITQKGADAMLLTTTKYEVAQEGGQIEIEVKANVNYQMEISEDAKEWITESKSKSRALTTHKHKLDIAMNESTEKREGEITFKSGDKVETVKVYQAGGAIILLSQNEFTVSDTGETISVDIKSNVEYGVQMPDVDWIKDEASSRGMSSHTLKYVVEANEGYDSRSAEIIFYDKNSDLKDTLKVVQAQKDAIVISKKEYEIKAEGETIEVKLSANVDFEVTMPEVDWITQAESRGLTEHKLYFKVAENASEESRSAEIVFVNKDSQLSEKISITQQGVFFLQLTENECTVSDAGETIEVEVKSNVEYGIKMPEVDWITQDVSGRAVSAETLKFIVEANETYDSRSAEIVFYDKNSDLTDTLKVIQAQKDAIILSQKEYEVKSEGETIEVKLSANVDFEVTMPEVDWISQTESRALTEHTLYFKVAENTSNDNRSAKIIIKQKKSELNDSIIINQLVKAKVVTLEKAGTMRSLLGADYLNIVSLKVVGPINADDVYYLRRMLGGTDFSETDRGKLTTLDLSDVAIDEIWDCMFSKCENLRHIVLPNNIVKIGYDAFRDCSSLTSINIPSSVTSIRSFAFGSCSSLTSVCITDIAAWCKINFDYASNPLSKVNCYVGSKPSKLYLDNKLLEELVIPEEITEIKDYAFAGYFYLTSIIFHNGVTSIGKVAFADCSSLVSINIPDGVTSIGGQAFADCSSLASVTIGEGITSLEYRVFSNCASLTSVDISDSVSSIGEQAFSNCSSLASINIPNGVTSIGRYAFENCSSLVSIAIGKNVTSGEYAFARCPSLNSATINCKEVFSFMFKECYSLVNLTLGDNVEKISNNAFSAGRDGKFSIEKLVCYSTTPPALDEYYNIPSAGTSGLKTEGNAFYIKSTEVTRHPSGYWTGSKIREETCYIKTDAILYVPVGYEVNYVKWRKYFKQIVEMD